MHVGLCPVFLGEKLPLVQYHQAGVPWPSTDILRGMTFDYTIHEPKYEGISPIYSPDFTPSEEGRTTCHSLTHTQTTLTHTHTHTHTHTKRGTQTRLSHTHTHNSHTHTHTHTHTYSEEE